MQRDDQPQGVTCKHCIFLQNRSLHDAGSCSKEGVSDTSPVCPSFYPDVLDLRESQNRRLNPSAQLIAAIRDLDHRKIPILIQMLEHRADLNKHTDYIFLQEVYIRHSGSGDYLSNYCKGFVLGATRNEVLVTNEAWTFTVSLATDINSSSRSVLSAQDFSTLKARLLTQGRVHDPDHPSLVKSEHVPSIDAVIRVQGNDLPTPEPTKIGQVLRSVNRKSTKPPPEYTKEQLKILTRQTMAEKPLPKEPKKSGCQGSGNGDGRTPTLAVKSMPSQAKIATPVAVVSRANATANPVTI